MITETDYKNAALLLGVEPNIIKAIKKVESNGSGFLKDGRVKVLFEGHIFWKELKKVGVQPETVKPEYGDILYPRWTSKHYKGGGAEWDRWSKAVNLCKALKVPTAAALNSASYGAFQTMGFNHGACGYATAHEMIIDYKIGGEPAQLIAVCNLIKNNGWDRWLNPLNVVEFVKRYNGPGYKKNKYDEKFLAAL